jgi:peptidoglycan lytic transglycosylase
MTKFAWAAAIQTSLRDRFGRVRHGSNASYALVEGTNKKAIVKINDVGPLKPGRVIDFDEQTMRYFDPSLRLGVIQNVRITPLPGTIGRLDRSPKGNRQFEARRGAANVRFS